MGMQAHFQILYNTEKYGVCLCDVPIGCDGTVFTVTEKQAQRRVDALKAIGIEAWYEPIKGCWADDDRWIG